MMGKKERRRVIDKGKSGDCGEGRMIGKGESGEGRIRGGRMRKMREVLGEMCS